MLDRGKKGARATLAALGGTTVDAYRLGEARTNPGNLTVNRALAEHSGFSSSRLNLSPFTKDFRGRETFIELFFIFLQLLTRSLYSEQILQ